jgi:hypothetical protein
MQLGQTGTRLSGEFFLLIRAHYLYRSDLQQRT